MTELMETVATHPSSVPQPLLRTDESQLIEALRAGDEHAFEVLLDRLSPGMLGLAISILSDRGAAEEVVQETWLAVIRGLDRFEARSSLKTWVFSILANLARTRVKRERRTVAFSSLSESEGATDALAAAAERLTDYRHAWMSPPRHRKRTPEDDLSSQETLALIQRTLQSMPVRQAEVVTLRDIEGWSAQEVCEALGLTGTNQKVLLHRGRTKVRDALTFEVNPQASPQASPKQVPGTCSWKAEK